MFPNKFQGKKKEKRKKSFKSLQLGDVEKKRKTNYSKHLFSAEV